MLPPPPQVTIIIATFNVEKTLAKCLESIKKQTNKNFELIIIDGKSTDRTHEIIQDNLEIINDWISEPDFGIYDALNKGVKRSNAEYYLVLGADDELRPDAIQNYTQAINSSSDKPDLISALVSESDRTIYPKKRLPSLYGHLCYLSQHAVGTLIRKDLHQKYGYYSKKFPIAADQFFIKRVGASKASKILYTNFVAGYYSREGVSGTDILGSMTEFFRVQMATENYRLIQVLIFIIRLLRHLPKILQQIRTT